VTLSSHSSNQSLDKGKHFVLDSIVIYNLNLAEQQIEGPSVDPNALNNDSSNKILDPKKTTIGQRRAPQAKKVFLSHCI
jgi:hypothetical protein